MNESYQIKILKIITAFKINFLITKNRSNETRPESNGEINQEMTFKKFINVLKFGAKMISTIDKQKITYFKNFEPFDDHETF